MWNKKIEQFKRKNKSFTLIEVIIAIFLLTTGIFGAYTVIQQTIINASISNSKLTAAYLAQEGIEIIRNIRDTNWLQARNATSPWNDGLDAGDWEADYTTITFSNTANFETCASSSDCDTYDGDFLKIDGSFYNYSSGTNTKFKRKITITPDGADILKVLVEVSWQEGTVLRDVSVQENFYNWR